ncbi:16S rRNA (cytosine(967)-C(5))-methyltransferase RsmB [Shouchella lehensis]|uniref:16S rRNA (cytosine(967)-C(5))-methyltransferase n=2 Tax=Shouchella lehensis TaxID=300825 RepID=A0A060LXF4_9BACI|nr:16S rRNA (cytosine(967)-C(5))-methyltransferase RsmB [Shouchella lehensis]AIC94882.1 ribosomal RNA small subunit methyltransferase B [Shouchella lehensis G1]MBG9784266.1 16S rRNA methyltransferase [Shouchella lehensis]RQW20722.1 16S rRNA (cytosine(967)-C(5))-methyltransferase RsmB [Bacillus sp. C1-1]TES50744.1 16S rRNA (cytosine(967)-C(5))-methyltransferase RsmB [Shouchella lehensis]
MTKDKATVREVAMDALVKIEKNQAYSHLLVNHTLKEAGLSHQDTGLLTELVYGTVARRLTLDYYLAPFLTKSKKKRELWVDVLLRLSVYQMVYLDRIPDRAIVHEAVTIANKRGHKGISGLVNGVLRSIQREGLPTFSAIKDEVARLAIETSHPEWLLKKWIEQYSYDEARAMAFINNEPPETSLRVNRMKATVEQVIRKLDEEGVEVVPSVLLPDLAVIVKKGNPFSTAAYQNGYFTAQDEASMLVGLLVGAEENMDVLDTCAAPGGKTTHLAETLNGTGSVTSFDLHKQKIKLIHEQVTRLQLPNVTADTQDAKKLTDRIDHSYNRVLVDAPCTGLGVIRRKPDIRWSKTEEDINRITHTQQLILANASQFVQPTGTLVYSTCTVDREENERVVEAFLSNHPFVVDEAAFDRLPKQVRERGRFGQYGLTILPQDFQTDGFFMVALKHV